MKNLAATIGQPLGLVRSTRDIIYRTPRILGKKLSVISHGMNAQKAKNMNIVSFIVICSNYYCLKNKPPQSFGQNHHPPVICQNDQQGGKGRGTHYISSRPFRKHKFLPLTTYICEYTRKVTL